MSAIGSSVASKLGAAVCFIVGLTNTSQSQEADVIHWWTSGGEKAAVSVLEKGFSDIGGKWIDLPILSPDIARTHGIERIYEGKPPTAMQFNTGKQFDQLVENDKLQDLNELADSQKWRNILPSIIVDAITYNGKFYAAPINIHGDNWFWINKKIFTENAITIPEKYSELIEIAPELRNKGIIPLAVGAQSWQRRIVFNSVLLAEAGREVYLSVLGDNDAETIRGKSFANAAATFRSLSKLSPERNQVESWYQATELVMEGKAALQITGDWAKGEFLQRGFMPGEDFECIIPNKEQGYILGGDVFVFPLMKSNDEKEAQQKLASIILTPEVQLAFNIAKGSIPVRTDIDTSSMDLCARRALNIIQDQSLQVPSGPYLVPEELNGVIDDVISEFWNNKLMSVSEFVDNYLEVVEYFRQ